MKTLEKVQNQFRSLSLGAWLVLLIVIGLLTYYSYGAYRNKNSCKASGQQGKTLSSAPANSNGSDQPILIIAGTNRLNSLTSAVAHYYAEVLRKKGATVQLLELSSLPSDFIKTALYENIGKNEVFNQAKIQMEQAHKYLFIVPEYNGTFPGVLKAFMDGLELPATFIGKKCALVGVSQGGRGGSFALSHLTDIFHYLRMNVYPLKPTLSNIIDGRIETVLANSTYVRLLEEQADGLINF